METQIEKSKIDTSILIYDKASMLVLKKEEENTLKAPFDEKIIEIRPDGLIYLPQTFWRERLNQTFGYGQWALIPKSENIDKERNKMYLKGVLIVRSHFVAEAVGEAEYHQNNTMQSWASVWESAKSDCITRCCKDLGIANELWQPAFILEWIKNYAVKVFVTKKDGKKAVQWRRKDREKFWNESGAVGDSSETTEGNPNSQYAEDNRKWLSQKQFDEAIKEINEGNTDKLESLVKEFKMKKTYKEQLEKAHEFSLTLKKPTIQLSELLIENINKCQTVKELNEIWSRQTQLHSNQDFIKLVTDKKKELAQTV